MNKQQLLSELEAVKQQNVQLAADNALLVKREAQRDREIVQLKNTITKAQDAASPLGELIGVFNRMRGVGHTAQMLRGVLPGSIVLTTEAMVSDLAKRLEQQGKPASVNGHPTWKTVAVMAFKSEDQFMGMAPAPVAVDHWLIQKLYLPIYEALCGR